MILPYEAALIDELPDKTAAPASPAAVLPINFLRDNSFLDIMYTFFNYYSLYSR
jgi:hypothetical protein